MGASVERTKGNVLTLYYDQIAAGWEKHILLTSDHHFDSAKCDRALLTEMLGKAKERNADTFVFGDLFDAMQGREDRRRSMSDLRAEYKNDAYLNRIVDDAAKFYGPYAKQLRLISMGNHETAVRLKTNYDLVSGLITMLNMQHSGDVSQGGYGGWVRFMFRHNKTKQVSKKLKYHHGSGGGGEVTRGTIQTNRQAVYEPDADFVVNGHTHDGWVVPIARERLGNDGSVHKDIVWFIRTPSFKDAFGDGSDGWDNETWKPPKPMGGVWLRFYCHDGQIQCDVTPEVR